MLKARNNYQIAFDPGMTGCGYSIWNNGVWQCVGTITPRGSDHLSKLRDLSEKLNDFYFDLLNEPHSNLEVVAIEEWERYMPRCKVATMLKSAEGRGVLIALSHQYGKEIKFVSKGTKSKLEAQIIAFKSGIQDSKHAIDAYHLGLLAGFGEVIGRRNIG